MRVYSFLQRQSKIITIKACKYKFVKYEALIKLSNRSFMAIIIFCKVVKKNIKNILYYIGGFQ